MPTQPPKLRIKYARAAECRSVPVSGAWGGVTTSGQIMLGLYQDAVDEPGTQIRNQQTGKEEPESTVPAIEVTREIQTLAFMSPSTARVISEWLKNMADQADAARKKAK